MNQRTLNFPNSRLRPLLFLPGMSCCKALSFSKAKPKISAYSFFSGIGESMLIYFLPELRTEDKPTLAIGL